MSQDGKEQLNRALADSKASNLEARALRSQISGAVARCEALESELAAAQAERAGLHGQLDTTQTELQVMQKRAATLGLRLAQARQQLKSTQTAASGQASALADSQPPEQPNADNVQLGSDPSTADIRAQQGIEDELCDAKACLAKAQANTQEAEAKLLAREQQIDQLERELSAAKAMGLSLKAALLAEQHQRMGLDAMVQRLSEQLQGQSEAAAHSAASAKAAMDSISQELLEACRQRDEAEQKAQDLEHKASEAEAQWRCELAAAQSKSAAAQEAAAALSQRMSQAEAERGHAQVLAKRALAECAATAASKADALAAMQQQLVAAEARAPTLEHQLENFEQLQTEAAAQPAAPYSTAGPSSTEKITRDNADDEVHAEEVSMCHPINTSIIWRPCQ